MGHLGSNGVTELCRATFVTTENLLEGRKGALRHNPLSKATSIAESKRAPFRKSVSRETQVRAQLFLDQAWRVFGIIAACEKSGSYFFSLQK